MTKFHITMCKMAERKQRRLTKLNFEDDGDDASADNLASTDDNDSDCERDTLICTNMLTIRMVTMMDKVFLTKVTNY